MIRNIVFIILIGLLSSVEGFANTTQSNNEFSIQTGSFICKMNNCIIYSYTEDDVEYPLFKLYSLDLKTKNSKLIDNQVQQNCWAKTSDSTLIYSKSGVLNLWCSSTQKSISYLSSGKSFNTYGLDFNIKHNCLMLFDLDKNENCLILNVIDSSRNVMFTQKIGFNELEMECLVPHTEVAENYFVFSIQDMLYALDLSTKELALHLISDKCDCFALYEDQSFLFYKFISDEKTNGFITKFDGFKTSSIDSNINDKIYNCAQSDLISAKIDGKNTPVYIICGIPYIFTGFTWELLSDVIIFKSDGLIVKPSHSKREFDLNRFEWNWRNN